MGLRLLVPALALAAVIAGMGGAGGPAFTVLLMAIVGASARGLVAVGDAAEARAGLTPVVLAGVSLLAVLAAAATRTPGVAVLSIVALGIEELGTVRVNRRKSGRLRRPLRLATESSSPDIDGPRPRMSAAVAGRGQASPGGATRGKRVTPARGLVGGTGFPPRLRRGSSATRRRVLPGRSAG